MCTLPGSGDVTTLAEVRPVVVIAVAVVLVVACSTDDGRALPPAVEPLPTTTTTTTVPTLPGPSLRLVAPWGPDGLVPTRSGCGTDADAPAVSWTGVPDGTAELAVVFSIDGVPQEALVGVEPTTEGLTEATLPEGAFWWPPSAVDARWPGWCTDDPEADLQITVYALNQQVEAADDTSVTELVGVIAFTAIGQATVIGRLDVPPAP